jgi:hypothetical protein
MGAPVPQVARARPLLGHVPQPDQLVGRRLRDGPHPASDDLAERDRVQVVPPDPAVALHQHEAGLLQHLEVCHHAEARHLGMARAELTRRARSVAEQVQQRAPGRVREGLEDEVSVT